MSTLQRYKQVNTGGEIPKHFAGLPASICFVFSRKESANREKKSTFRWRTCQRGWVHEVPQLVETGIHGASDMLLDGVPRRSDYIWKPRGRGIYGRR